MTSKLLDELVKASKIPLKDESPDSLRGLVKKVSSLEDSDWMSLSEESQIWINKAAKAMNNGTRLPKFGDEVEEVTAKAAEVPESEESSDSSSSEKRKGGVCTRLQELLIDHEDWGMKAVEQALKEEGFSCSKSTIAGYVHSVRSVMKMLSERGRLVESTKE